MNKSDLSLDGKGDVITQPVMTWTVAAVSDGVLLVLHYVDTPEQLQSGERLCLQAFLTPEQAVQMGETLLRTATKAKTGHAPTQPGIQ